MPAVTLSSSIPASVSLEEHQALLGSTPASFNDIPPVLRHEEENVSVTLDPPLEGFSEQDCAQGTLYVIDSVLVFISTTGRGFQIKYPALILHAISRAQSGPSIYCQLDDRAGDEENVPADDEDVTDMRELVIIPKSEAALEPIFSALSVCAFLNPDKATANDDDMDDAFVDISEGGFETFTGDESQELSEVGRAALEYLESIIYDPHDHSQQPNGVNGHMTIGNHETDGTEESPRSNVNDTPISELK